MLSIKIEIFKIINSMIKKFIFILFKKKNDKKKIKITANSGNNGPEINKKGKK